jgi:glycosyltransferase involved in cell wall biosynthesis
LGPEDNVFTHCKLHGYTNIHFLGAQDVNRLPEYIKALMYINPQLLNETTKGNYPRKIDEYLAMGKPVVATRQLPWDILKIGFIWQRLKKII